MHVKWTKSAIPVLVGIACLMASAGTTFANCISAVVQHGLTSSFEQCGPNASAFFWGHGRAVQRIIASEANGAVATIAGHDSGRLQNLADVVFIEGPGGAAAGSYLGSTDGANTGADGCFLRLETANATCQTGGQDFDVLDYVIGGVDPAQPNVGRMAAVSVDFNQFFQFHFLDHAGAAAVDGDNCGGDAFSGVVGPVNCSPIPVPSIVSSAPAPGGTNITVGLGDVSGIPILDDCNIAETRATNCPRNLYAGRVVVFQHGSCTSAGAPGLDRRSFAMPAGLPPTGSFTTLNPTWITHSREDANLNGVLDPAEDGSNGGTANSRLDPTIVGGTAPAQTTVFVPAVAGATDCIFIGLAIGLDNNQKFVNPPTNTIVGEMVLSPVVSLNPNPIRAGSGTPVSDHVIELRASKTQGKGTVDWTTGIELTTSGFNVIGTKKGGGEVKINANLIAAKEGTTGKGASYTLSFDGGQLKGSTAVYVEVVKNNGQKERFGPASF